MQPYIDAVNIAGQGLVLGAIGGTITGIIAGLVGGHEAARRAAARQREREEHRRKHRQQLEQQARRAAEEERELARLQASPTEQLVDPPITSAGFQYYDVATRKTYPLDQQPLQRSAYEYQNADLQPRHPVTPIVLNPSAPNPGGPDGYTPTGTWPLTNPTPKQEQP